MAKLKFPKTIFVAVESDGTGKEWWLNAHKSQDDIGAKTGEEKEIAEYRLIKSRKFRGVLKEI